MRTDGDAPELRARIAGMDCGSCAHTLEDGLRKLPGVLDARVDFTSQVLVVKGVVSQERVQHRVQQLGYRLLADEPQSNSTSQRSGYLSFAWSQPQQRRALAGCAITLAVLLSGHFGSFGLTAGQVSGVLAALTLLVGAPIALKGLRALLFSRRVTIDLLMAVAALGALLIGEVGEAATVVMLFTLGEGLEGFSASRARDSLRSLMALQPDEATLLRRSGTDDDRDHGHEHHHEHDHDHDSGDDHGHGYDHDHGQHHHGQHAGGDDHAHPAGTVRAGDLAPGDVILVRPGERIAADGVIRAGSSSVNEAAVTGESIPVLKEPGDTVMAGTVNAEGALEVEVTTRTSDSTVARIACLVEQAQAQRAPAERFIDRFARWYTPAVIVLAVLVVALPVLLFSQPLLDEQGARGWLYRGLTLLIVACPCALIISIPVTVVSSLTRLARMGVLVKGGEHLDRLPDIRAVAFDKTGTLTHGRPKVTAIQAPDCSHELHTQPDCAGCDNVIALAAAVERGSEHPIAYAIMQTAQARGLDARYPAAESITAVAGRGVTGSLHGSRIAVGTDALLVEQGADADRTEFRALRESSRTVMTVAIGSEVMGAIGVEDPVRDESRAALGELRAMHPPVRTVMLTGDNSRVAAHVALSVGAVDEVRAGLLPAGKLAAIEEIRRAFGPVAMVGDGINDAPALASADVGIAMGAAGTAQAMETADVVLMQDDLHRVPTALRIARQSRSVVKQNIALSLGLKLAFLALVIPGWTTLWLAVVADVGATMLVTLNGMRMLRAQ